MDLNKINKIYMIGVKGVGMTMLAQYLSACGIKISGSDIKESFMTDKVLRSMQAEVKEGFDISNIDETADLYIYSTAYTPETNPEVAAVMAQKKPVMTFAQALGQVFSDSFGVAVCGSHGKTTTSAWLGYVLEKGGKSPSVLVGATVPQFNGSGLVGKSDYMVIEADEYQNKFQYFSPQAVLINNIDFDHPDEFSSPDEYTRTFADFIQKIPKRGFLVANNDDSVVRRLTVQARAKVVTYSIKQESDYIAYNIKNIAGGQVFSVKLGIGAVSEENTELSGMELGEFNVALSGTHNVYNALAVIAAASELGVELSSIRQHLAEFIGTARRMEFKGKFRGAVVIDDYAHHPTEIKTTLNAVRGLYPDKKLITVFHPHTFSRTKALLNDFAGSFGDTDILLVLDIYGSAREKQGGVHSRDIINKISALKGNKPEQTLYTPDIKTAVEYLRQAASNNDVILLMGAGDVFRVWDELDK